MGEQDLRIDPETGFPRSDRRSQDAKQNKHYVRHADPHEVARDFSRPRTIPREEYEAATGRNHEKDCAEFDANQEAAAEAADAERRKAEHGAQGQ
jgi:hypothetical protein